ncbi:MAG: hypothetical protein IJG34_05375 [Synergistaceae bacterium]|nr:hypothetical protein [Synergistaceae bacterium]MBQ9628881.1 hypothetical protein [Synergistaceae bacterium]
MKELLLLFTSSLPCWDEECVLIAGENPNGLHALVESGDLMPVSSGYVLTPKGIRTRENAARELYLPVTPAGEVIIDSSRAKDMLELNRMTQLLDRAFVTDWGIKEVTVRENFPVVPCLDDNEYFVFEGERVKAVWPESERVKNFVNAFPNIGVAARKFNAPGQHGLDEWVRKNNMHYGSLIVDFVLRGRADFNHYKDYEQLPSDKFKFLDADRLFVKKVNCSPEELLPFIGKLHIFMTEQRRIFLPGWFDIDHDENEDWNLLAFITDTESQLESLTSTLRKWGHDLIDPVNPLFIIGSSIERLRSQREQKRTIYDWFQEETIRILRPDAPDGE